MVEQLSLHLSAEETDVFIHMTREDRNDYEKLKKTLLEHYHINPDTYRSRLDKTMRKSGQTWAVTANKARQMYLLGECSTLEDAIELGTIDAITKMMPHQLGLYVKEKKPTIVREVVVLADEFMLQWNWSYDGVSTSDQPWNKQQRREDRNRPQQEKGDKKQDSAPTKEKSWKERANCKSTGNRHDHGFRPKCYRCGQPGHLAAECWMSKKPKERSKLDSVNLLELLSQSQEVDLVEAKICHKETVEGTIGGTPCNGILLDTGASRTVVNDKLVQPEWYTGKTWTTRGFDGPVRRYPLAKIVVKVNGFEQEMEVMVAGMDYDALLGKDVPGLWVLGKRLLYDNLISVFSTRSRKTELQRTAGDHPDPESDDGNSGKSRSEEEMVRQGRTDHGRGCRMNRMR